MALSQSQQAFQQLNRNPDSVPQMIHSLCCEQFDVGTNFPLLNYTCSRIAAQQEAASTLTDSSGCQTLTMTVRGNIHSVADEEFHLLYSGN